MQSVENDELQGYKMENDNTKEIKIGTETTTETLETDRLQLDHTESLTELRFNQDHSCFSVGIAGGGFIIYGTNPIRERFRRRMEKSEQFSIVEMLFKSNIVVCVAVGSTRVLFWDDHEQRIFAELQFDGAVVRNVLVRQADIFIVVLERHVVVYNWETLSVHSTHATCFNPTGIAALSYNSQYPGHALLALPGKRQGTVHLLELHGDSIIRDLTIDAHVGRIAQLHFNGGGRLLATSSETGTIVRLWKTSSGTKSREFRRGKSAATIFNITFSKSSNYMMVGSDTGTVHVYSLHGPEEENRRRLQEKKKATSENRKSRFFFMADVLPDYFSSSWSCVSFTVNLPAPHTRYLCTFDSEDDHTIVIISQQEKTYLKYAFQPNAPKGERVTLLGQANFIRGL